MKIPPDPVDSKVSNDDGSGEDISDLRDSPVTDEPGASGEGSSQGPIYIPTNAPSYPPPSNSGAKFDDYPVW